MAFCHSPSTSTSSFSSTFSSDQSVPSRRFTALNTALVTALVLSLLSLSVLSASSAGAHHDSGNHGGQVSLYDTAWDLPTRATDAEIITYLDHIDEVGFTGFWISFLPLDGWALENTYELGVYPAWQDEDGYFGFNFQHKKRMNFILDEALERDLEVVMAPAWGVGYIHGHWPDHSCQNLNKGPLKAYNAEAFGERVGELFGGHEALKRWLFGGDNFCNLEDSRIWTNMASGVRSAGAKQPIGYHTPSDEAEHQRFANLPWHDFYAPQTSHCTKPKEAGSSLASLVAAAGEKQVFAAELRYEAIEPPWRGCRIHGVGEPVTPEDVLTDVRVATEAGVDGIVYGHNERWQWGGTVAEAKGRPMNSLGSPGEQLAIEYLRNQGLLPGALKPVVKCGGRKATIIGTSGNDVLRGTNGVDVIVGLGGDDIIEGLRGRDRICGMGGNDRINGGPGNDRIDGGDGNDRILGSGGGDSLIGGAGSDYCHGGKGRNTGKTCETQKKIRIRR